jgi:VanZ family protein
LKINIREVKRNIGKRWLPWLPSLAVMLLIFSLSSIPGSNLPHLFSFQDVVLHAIIYAVLGFSYSGALKSNFSAQHRHRRIALAALLCLFYGLSDEFHQMFIPGRTAALDDVLVDAAGGLLGGLIKK